MRIRRVDAGMRKLLHLMCTCVIWCDYLNPEVPSGYCFIHLSESQRPKWGFIKIWMVNSIQKVLSVLSCTCRVKAEKICIAQRSGSIFANFLEQNFISHGLSPELCSLGWIRYLEASVYFWFSSRGTGNLRLASLLSLTFSFCFSALLPDSRLKPSTLRRKTSSFVLSGR